MSFFSSLLRLLAVPLLLGTSVYAQPTAPTRFYGGNLPTGGQGSGASALADMNRDGKLDYLTADQLGRAVIVRHGDGAGSFTTAGRADSLGRYPVRLQVADVNVDGWPDIVTLNPTDNTLSVRLNNGAGGYRGFELRFPYYYARDLYIADVTQDGIPDYVVMHWSTQIEVYVGDGTGRFTYTWPGLSTWFNNGAFELYPADVNNDGKLDMVGSGFNELQIRYGNGDGTFGNIVSTPNPSTPASEVRVGDINNDGRPDLLAVDYNRNTIYTHLQTATGGFVAADTVTTTISPYPLRVADMNGDGNLDLIAGTDDSGWPGQPAPGGAAEIRYGDGTGSFGPSLLVPLSNDTSADLITGDINGDGRLDFLTANYDNTYSVRLNSVLPSAMQLKYTLAYSYTHGLSQLVWNKGNAANRVVFIREVRPGRAPLAEPVDGITYSANLQEMSSRTRVAGGTYTLGPGPAADTLAYLRNGAIGHVYEAAVYEYAVDPVLGPIYRRDNSIHHTFTTARLAPQLTGVLTNNVPALSWTIDAQYKALAFQVQKSTDGVTFTDEGAAVAAADSAASRRSYSLPSAAPVATRTYYRVELTHTDGTVLHSNVVALGSVPLPVELVAFTGKLRPDGRAQLSWTTAQEKNSHYFEVQRSLDGRSFERIGRVDAAGNSTQRLDYTHTDTRPLSTATYYRLNQVDLDGTWYYSSVVVISPSGTPLALTTWPNPASAGERPAVRLSGLTNLSVPVRLQLRSTTGQLLREQSVPAASTVEWNVPLDGLAPGVYLIEAQAAEGRWRSKLLVR